MEAKELIAKEIPHKTPNDKCPFCPPPSKGNYKTYPGSQNDSDNLGNIMIDPGRLTSLQAGARPQSSRVDANGYVQEQARPKKRLKKKNKNYTFQAHHLISGHQAMKGEPFEQWIVGGKRIQRDTGYSINCTGNGYWAPSIPHKYVGEWGKIHKKLTDDQRQELAEEVMKHARAQVHIGPHHISDPNDSEHVSYHQYIKLKLKEIDDRISAWMDCCYLCKPKKKPQTTHHVHDVLDNLSKHMQAMITGNRKNWKTFLSKYALEYHKKNPSKMKKRK